MAEFEYRFAWRKDDPALVRDAKAFWRNLAVLSPEDMEERAGQLCAAAYRRNELIAAATVHLFDWPRLRARFAYYRTMVAPDVRHRNLASHLCVYSRDLLAQWARENPEERLKGLFIVLQAEEFRHHKHVHLPVGQQLDLDLVLVGYTPGGHQIRVVWFKDATVEF